MQPYNYTHREGTEEITWEMFNEVAASLKEKLVPEGVEIIAARSIGAPQRRRKLIWNERII